VEAGSQEQSVRHTFAGRTSGPSSEKGILNLRVFFSTMTLTLMGVSGPKGTFVAMMVVEGAVGWREPGASREQATAVEG
jgi:hypothetical protein